MLGGLPQIGGNGMNFSCPSDQEIGAKSGQSLRGTGNQKQVATMLRNQSPELLGNGGGSSENDDFLHRYAPTATRRQNEDESFGSM